MQSDNLPPLPFPDTLNARIDAVNSRVCVGIDPELGKFPLPLLAQFGLADVAQSRFSRLDPERVGACLEQFSAIVLEATHKHAAAVKPQIAYFERYGSYGIAALEKTVALANAKGLPVILDGKRNDIGSTATQYALAYLGYDNARNDSPLQCDALTINPYLGSDGVLPFVHACEKRGKGIFVLVKTSNPSSGEFQDMRLETGETLAQRVARMVNVWGESTGKPDGYSSVGAVVGATYPEDIRVMRAVMPRAIFLIPGYGAQGATAADIAPAFDAQGLGAIINASRSILYPYAPDDDDFAAKISASAQNMKDDINAHLRK